VSEYGRPLSVSGRPCYFANVFIYLFIFYGGLFAMTSYFCIQWSVGDMDEVWHLDVEYDADLQ